MSRQDELDAAPSVDPYKELEIPEDANDETVKKAYRKLALKYHPDKAATTDQGDAKERFQRIAAAYAILSDSKRRARYDATGSTEESFLEDEDFDWADFYNGLYQEVTVDRIADFSSTYKGSDEERRDLLKAYTKCKGNMHKIYAEVMLSDVLVDDDRFRKILDQAIQAGEVEAFDKYTSESQKSKENRLKSAQRRAKEGADTDWSAEASKAQERKKKRQAAAGAKDDPSDMASLQAMIMGRQQARSNNFLDRIAEKYAEPVKKGSKRAKHDGPTEEDFENMGKRKKTKSKA